jgi:hypothetical protein
MNYLTMSEKQKVHEITKRLEGIASPVLRLQAILQFSQIVDILVLGDTYQVNHERHMSNIFRLEDEVNELKVK